jgi:transcriptional regulator with XRE-family HTH domain
MEYHNYIREFGSMLSVARNKTGKKAKDMAPLIGVSCGTLSHIESGNITPRIDRVPSLAKFYRLDENLLSQAFLKAMEQREREKDLNKWRVKDRKPKVNSSLFTGQIESLQNLGLTNFGRASKNKYY